ncbi:MAG TPA: protein SdhA [Legionella sp.]|nr:protein SdhA [Legionella sp.]
MFLKYLQLFNPLNLIKQKTRIKRQMSQSYISTKSTVTNYLNFVKSLNPKRLYQHGRQLHYKLNQMLQSTNFDITEYIKILESFKEHQISVSIASFSETIFKALKNPKLHPKVAVYFKEINEEGEPFSDYELDPANVSQVKKLVNALYHARLAFIDLENIDVRNISRSVADLKQLYRKTIHEAYQACYLLTHLDVNIVKLFQHELLLFLELIIKFQTTIEKKIQEVGNKYAEEKEQLTDTIHAINAMDIYQLSKLTGNVSGITIDQMQPSSGSFDYNFLTQFGAVLPGYINKLTCYINKYSAEITEKEPALNNEKMQELQRSALSLLNDLEHLKSNNSLFISFKFLKYIHIVRNIITLSMSTLEQIGNLSHSSQDLIRENLSQLKYVILPTLFGIVDKVEINCMLKPGTLSIPLMEKIKSLYQILIYYAAKPVNFMEKGEELLTIEDTEFLKLRLERTYKRIDNTNAVRFQIGKATAAMDSFFAVLEKPQNKNKSLSQLPDSIKADLTEYYKLLQPYVDDDVDLNNLIVHGLQHKNWSYHLNRPWFSLTNQLPPDHISVILAAKETIEMRIVQAWNTQKFLKKLNKSLIQFVHESTDLILFPHNKKENPLKIDESQAFSIPNLQIVYKSNNNHKFISNPNILSAKELMMLQQWYQNKRKKLKTAHRAYEELMELGEQHQEINEMNQAKYRKLYNLFQPYLIHGVSTRILSTVRTYDEKVVKALNASNKNTFIFPNFDFLKELDLYFQQNFSEYDLFWQKRIRFFSNLANNEWTREHSKMALKSEPDNAYRAHFLLHHTHYSQFIHEFRKAIEQTVIIFNSSMQSQLQMEKEELPYPELNESLKKGKSDLITSLKANINSIYHSTKLPFPEIEDPVLLLSQAKQVIAIKGLFNSLFHLEGIVLQLEKLNHKSTETRYVFHLILAYGHINELIKTFKNMAHDPHLSLLASQLSDKVQTIWATIQEHSFLYQITTDSLNNHPMEYPSLGYVLKAFNVIPNHLRSLRNTSYLTTEELNELQTKANNAYLTIESLIKNSNSYLKLFLQAKNTWRLYKDMTNKLKELISTSHDMAMNNLEKLKSLYFTPMLLKADRFEARLGLKPGILANPLKKMLDEFYKGLLIPFKLESKKFIPLICDYQPLEQRLDKRNEKLTKISESLLRLEDEYKQLIEMRQYIKNYNAYSSPTFLPPDTQHLKLAQDRLKTHYKEGILHQLVALINNHKIKIPTSLSTAPLDNILNSGIEAHHIKLTHIEFLVNSAYHHYLGLKATLEMKKNTTLEQLEFLEKSRNPQGLEYLAFIKKHTEEQFDKQVEAFILKDFRLHCVAEEYHPQLKKHLMSVKDIIVEEAKNAEDIDAMIEYLLQKSIQTYEAQHFQNFYKLEKIKVSLDNFRIYLTTFQQNDRNQQIFANKAEKIRTLNRITTKDVSIEQRIAEIKTIVDDPSFLRIMCAHERIDRLSFTYLKFCILSLLEALHLYTPPVKAYCNQLNNTLNKEQLVPRPDILGIFGKPNGRDAPEIKALGHAP